jgi:hypothetical protein
MCHAQAPVVSGGNMPKFGTKQNLKLASIAVQGPETPDQPGRKMIHSRVIVGCLAIASVFGLIVLSGQTYSSEDECGPTFCKVTSSDAK